MDALAMRACLFNFVAARVEDVSFLSAFYAYPMPTLFPRAYVAPSTRE
jgi:hypothetical protein